MVPKRFAEALKTSKDPRIVKYVAGQVALWPEEKAKPVLETGLAAQKAPGNGEAVELLESSLKEIK